MSNGEKLTYKEWTNFLLITLGAALLGLILQFIFGWNIISTLLAIIAIPSPIILVIWIFISIDKFFLGGGKDGW
jgi:hypothetical protein